MTPKYSQILWWPPPPPQKKKYQQNIDTPKNIHFSENPQKYWNSKFWTPQKMTQAYVYQKISESPPPLPLGMGRQAVRQIDR